MLSTHAHTMLDETSGHRSTLLQVHLTEYENIWTEVYARFDNQRQAFNYLISLLAVIAGLLASEAIRIEPEVFFWLPLIIAPFGFIFFDNEFLIWGIVNYTCNHLHEHVAELVDDNGVLLLERRRFTSVRTRRVHHFLSLGRWILFVVPVLVSMWYAAYYAPKWWLSWYGLLFAVDLLIASLLLWAIVRAAREQDIWKSVTKAV